MQHPEESRWCHTPSHNRPEMNPEAEEKTDGRKANEDPKERLTPNWNRVCGQGKVTSRGRSTVLQQNFHVRLKQCRLEEAVGLVVDRYRLALHVTNELFSFVLSGKFAPVMS